MADVNAIIDPKIETDDISMEDIESPESDTHPRSTASTDRKSAQRGSLQPVVKINTNVVQSEDLKAFDLEWMRLRPRLSVRVADTKGKLSFLDFPFDGDVVSIYIRPKNKDEHRSIKADFDIIDIKGVPKRVNEYIVECILKIPRFTADMTFDPGEKTAFDHLGDICEELSIGLASNISSTDDKMNRFAANEPPKKFIQETVRNAYKGDESFFASHIDPYYYLNFVDVNQQFKDMADMSLSDDQVTNMLEHNPREVQGISESGESGYEGPLFLTNRRDHSGTDHFIQTWAPNNQTANIWMKNGYKKHCQYFDIAEDEYRDEFADGLTTEGLENQRRLLKGRSDEEFYEEVVKRRWLGKQASGENGNVHDNFKYSQVLNVHNNEEIKKVTITVEMDTYNTNLYLYRPIYVILYEGSNYIKQGQKERDKNVGDEEAKNPENSHTEVRIEHLSGFYLIIGMNFVYKRGGKIRQRLLLSRREWPPAGNVDGQQVV